MEIEFESLSVNLTPLHLAELEYGAFEDRKPSLEPEALEEILKPFNRVAECESAKFVESFRCSRATRSLVAAIGLKAAEQVFAA